MSDRSKRFSTPDPALAKGTSHEGFTVTDVLPLPELAGQAYVMRHDASGARLMWIARDDPNKSFSIAFKTPPADSTGVFHILEHSVLCGSDSYPVKEPFVNLLKSSMQTFLNALTFPDKTMYPVASTNTQDLENLMGVYLDAVLHPAIYHRPRIFEQEGWHLELAEPEPGSNEKYGALSYNGVVFNEMKGALSDPDDVLYDALSEQLFPDTPYRFESGGDPRVIPTLTYERFLDTHARHYNLANSYTILYGDMDIERELAFIAKRFDGAEDRHAGAPNPLPLQTPVTPEPATITMATTPDNARVGLSYVIGTAQDRERVLACDILLDALTGSNEAPLKRAVLDANLADDFQAMLLDGMAQPQILFELRGSKPGVAPRFRELMEQECARLVSEGIPKDKLEASLAQAEFNLREGDYDGYADGVYLSIMAMSSWLYDDNRPVDYLRFEDELAHMRAGLDSGYFEHLLDELVCHSNHHAEVELVPTQEGSAAEEAAELAARKAAMSDAELDGVKREVEALRAEQGRPDAPEDLARLPRLTVSDIGQAPEEPAMEQPDEPLPCLYHPLPTNHIAYVYHYFDLSHISFEELPLVGVLTDVLGRLGTKEHDASSLDTLIEASLGNLSFFSETYGDDNDATVARPKLVVAASALSERLDALASIPQEIWSSTRFDDVDRLHDILQQRRISMEQQFVNAGNAAAASRVSAGLGVPAQVSEQLGGVEYYRFLRSLLDEWNERAKALPTQLQAIARRIFVRDDTIVSFTGSREDLTAYFELAGTLDLPAAQAPAASLVVPDPHPRREAFVIPSNVGFVALGQSKPTADTSANGTWTVASRVLSLDYLWNEVRVRGGAYGVGFRRALSGAEQFWSYRDPSIDATLTRYRGAADWLSNWKDPDGELEGYIVSCVAAQDAPIKARARGRRQDATYFSGRDPEWRKQLRSEELATTIEKVRQTASALASVTESDALCVFAPRDKVEASQESLEVHELFGTSSADGTAEVARG